ncbi:hypothetical protein B0H13DRAFT_1951005 [Mycena leptocephala]|nr:hypothetical protein B0H13DRAFT_2119128 [Mycena leptocephala]KAJ7904105.1 hypothetical protein B0H13DRAFT_2025193 [Mycena leptocephala]KAJ7934753.1 hypothetical protein B0H13DRAFT_1951005 [Mycena leptocephala]
MVWGYAKRLYRLKPESSREDQLEKNTMDSLDAVPLLFMRRYVNRCHRFGDAYLNHKLTGPQAAWAAKKYPGHRTYPASILEELDQAGVH